ncbi:MAG TPA: malto-oligosyltrehalose synthase [Burkholderiales bacterium]|nr:malto-oligosyltrehalose synthase [Burkholderiales bacterium]
MKAPILDRLCAACGIAPDYHDVRGTLHAVPEPTRRALLDAMGVRTESEAAMLAALHQIEAAEWRRFAPPVVVIRETQALVVPLSVSEDRAGRVLRWALELEGGERREGELIPGSLGVTQRRQIGGENFVRCAFALPEPPGPGYHWLELRGAEAEAPSSRTRIIVAPGRCYQPEAVSGEGRAWGPAVQLYAVRSRRNWGMGDFSDLHTILEFAAGAGAGIVGVNPLHALRPSEPEHASPYGASSRQFLNTLYIDVEAVADFAECEEARRSMKAPEFQARLRALRGAELVDYAGVAAAKMPVLERLYRHFREHHLEPDTGRGRAFREFQAAGGEALRGLAAYEALQEHFRRADPALWGWPVWPKPYRDPRSPEVAALVAERQERVEFHEYLQWQARLQLEACGRRSRELGLGVGLYGDLAVGVERGGAEAWQHQELYAFGASVGAPPDEFNLHGQDWGLPPLIPRRLREAAYEPFIALLRVNMRCFGALRIDHVMGLMRLFWIPAGASPVQGAYVHYPFGDLLGILALESQRNRCMVVGEDLGTVPDEVRAALAPMGVLSYRPFYFEREPDGAFSPPAAYPRDALVTVSTHDLPTLSGYWQGRDLDLRTAFGLFPSEELKHAQMVGRARDRAELLIALEREGLLPAGASVHPVANPVMAPELARAVHVYLARAPSRLLVVQPEDVLGQVDQVNLPGSRQEQHPNWRRKLALDLEEWPGDSRVQALAQALRGERGRAAQPKPAPAAGRPPARVPLATYRLQFHKDFTLARATELVPYLHELGVSHCYASPLLKARPGSTHGYDIVDHNALNPEIGDAGDLERFVEALRARGMGLILDIVPNHMGVQGSDNGWWLDVLENGPASRYARYFDIDWAPLKEELRGKVLLPVLGDHYGRVLESGELWLEFDPARGELSVRYHRHRFPIDPREYPRVLGQGLDRLGARLDGDEAFPEFQALMAAFGHLPARDEVALDKVCERARDKEIHKRRLAELCARSRDLLLFIEENVAAFNGTSGEPLGHDALHELIKAQAFRLAYWRVASDEINYRRFFDINDLAALRMEDEAVFAATHRLVFDLLREGGIDGLRIDHPDGLYDPGEYFRRLQLRAGGGPAAVPAPGKALYLVIEKILGEHERLAEDWPVHGTTGYRFANVVNGLFVDTSAAQKMSRIYAAFTGERAEFEEIAYGCKMLIMRSALASELNVLAGELSRIALASRHTCDFTLNSLRDALAEVVACFPVYRSYATAERVSAQDRRHIEWGVAVAKKRSPAADASVFDFVKEVLTTDAGRGRSEAYAERVGAFAMKFQQYTAPVMAKGVEDTAFYRYHRLVSLNEVGGDPRSFGLGVSAFHGASQDRARHWPDTMLASSTHDSKRSEDVRARINVLSEMPAAWKLSLRKWSRMNRSKKSELDGQLVPTRNDEYLLYQTLIGAWPAGETDAPALEAFRARIEAYMLKAVREAKVHSSWINPNPDYEGALARFIGAILGSTERNLFLADFVPAQRRIARFGLYNSLSATLVKIASPGVPDIYQGTEIWDLSLVDPDNRRPVDYARRGALLEELEALVASAGEELPARARGMLEDMEDGRTKLYVIWRALQARRQHPRLYQDGGYLPLAVSGARSEHVCAFARVQGDAAAVVVVPRLLSGLLGEEPRPPLGREVWEDTRVELPWEAGARYRNAFTGELLAAESRNGNADLSLHRVFGSFPVALLLRVGPAGRAV